MPMTRRESAPAPDPAPPPSDGPAVEARELCKRYGATVAVAGLSFAVGRGEVFGLLGPHGAGKTTTLELLAGLREPDGGAAFVEGRELGRARRAGRERIGVQLQRAALFPELSARDNLRLLAALYRRALPPDELLDLVGLADRAGAPLGTLPDSQQRRLALAAALVNDPAVVLLDEPTTGLDPAARRAIRAPIAGLRERGRTVVLATRDPEEAATLCDRVALLAEGRIVALDSPERLIARHGGDLAIACAFAGPVGRADLARLPDVTAVAAADGGGAAFTLRTTDLERTLVLLLHLAERRGAPLTELRVHQPCLADVLRALTERTPRTDY